MRRGPPCTICTHPKQSAIDARLAAGESCTSVALAFGCARATIEKHNRLHRRPQAVAGRVEEPGPPMPVVAIDASPREQSQAHCEWLRRRIAWAVKHGASEKDLAHLSGQYTSATRLYSRLSGALDITESQIVRSAPWVKLMAVMADTLKPWPAALHAVTLAIEAYAGERR